MPREVKISVVIPVFNAADHLRACLDSVVNQSLSDIEIIVINDGSTDASSGLLAEYEAADPRLEVVQLNTRGGASAARNLGIEKAAGAYLIFLDGDDFWTASNMLQDLYERCMAERLDVLEFGLYRSANSADKLPTTTGQLQVLTLGQHLRWTINYNINSKLISRQLMQAGRLRFDTHLILGEDALLSVQLYCRAERLGIYDKVYYFYRAHGQSLTGTGWDSNKLFSAVQWFEWAVQGMPDTLPADRRAHILRLIAVERLDKLLHRLGPIALDLLNTQQLLTFIQLWSRCLTSVDGVLAPLNAKSGNTPALPKPFLESIRNNDVASFRQFFLSDSYQKRRQHSPGNVTLSREQGLMVARTIREATGNMIRCNFGDGVFVTLPRTKAHQLAANLEANTQSYITLQFKL
tara:strand:+ start:762 stop:1982 length:1221 start_codon:yes stop_codon:yes gene_type:complete